MSLDNIRKRYRELGHKASFSGVARTANFHKISAKEAYQNLINIPTYTAFVQKKKPRRRNPYYAYVLHEYVQIDLVDMHQYAKHNNGVKFLLTCIDVYSRYGWCYPLINKTANQVKNGLEQTLLAAHPKVRNIYCDSGREFKNMVVKKLLQDNGIKMYHSTSDLKAALVERFNRTIEEIIFKYMHSYQTFKYVDVLKDIIRGYNNTPIPLLEGLTPVEAAKSENKVKVLTALNKDYMTFLEGKAGKSKTFKIGDRVRIKKIPTPFDKGYMQSWGDEIFKVVEINNRLPIPMYILESTGNDQYSKNKNERILGGFYPAELTLVGHG